MTPALPWLAAALIAPLAGVLAVAFAQAPQQAQRLSVLALAVATVCAGVAAAEALLLPAAPPQSAFGRFAMDGVATPLAPTIGLLHLLAALGTAMSQATRNLCARLLFSAFVALAAATSTDRWSLVVLVAAAALLPVWDLQSRGRSLRAYLVYLAPALGLTVAGLAYAESSPSPLGPGLMLAGLLIQAGIAPAHSWAPNLFAKGGFGSNLAILLPMTPVLALVRLVLPLAPDNLLAIAGYACLFTGLYAGGMAVAQASARRFYAYLALSQISLIVFAVTQHTSASLTAALCLWVSAALSLAGLAFPIRALEARFGDLSLRESHGYYAQAPELAVCFLVAGLGCVGFPGAVGFVPVELLVSGSMSQGLWVTAVLVVIATLNAIAILRAYFALFTGRRPKTSVSLRATGAERLGIVIVVAIVLLGGWLSPSAVADRRRQADELLRQREASVAAAGTFRPGGSADAGVSGLAELTASPR